MVKRPRGLRSELSILTMVVAAVAGACSGPSRDAEPHARPVAPEPPPLISSGHVGPAGGVVELSTTHVAVRLEVPPGAVVQDVALSARESADRLPGSVGPVVDLGPSGTEFAAPVRVTFEFPRGLFPVVTDTPVALATLVDDRWIPLDDVRLGPSSISGLTRHFSLFGVTLLDELKITTWRRWREARRA